MNLRATLNLGKFRVIERNADGFRIALGGTTEMNVRLADRQINYDIRAGDLLTLYTEVLIQPPKAS